MVALQQSSDTTQSPIVRKPIIRQSIIDPYYKRNSDYNPEFLDKETLLVKFDPLIRSIHKYFCSYAGILDQQSDVQDLYHQIQLEFLNLAQRYDPKRGVDFPGYIKLNLRHRIYYYVTKIQKQNTYEYLSKPFGCDGGDYVWQADKPDKGVDEEFNRVEVLNSIPWDMLTEIQRTLVVEVLYNHMALDQVAKAYGMPVKSVKDQFDRLCEMLMKLHNLRDE